MKTASLKTPHASAHELFARCAKALPDTVAVMFRETFLTMVVNGDGILPRPVTLQAMEPDGNALSAWTHARRREPGALQSASITTLRNLTSPARCCSETGPLLV